MDRFQTFVRSLDPKLVRTIVTFVAARCALELGIPWDPTLETALATILAAAVGYQTPNDATLLRTPQESGNAKRPKR